jgi:hypothetical protein
MTREWLVRMTKGVENTWPRSVQHNPTNSSHSFVFILLQINNIENENENENKSENMHDSYLVTALKTSFEICWWLLKSVIVSVVTCDVFSNYYTLANLTH